MHMEHDLHLENHMVSAQSLERYYGPKAEPTARAAYRATEKRLYRLPALRERVEDDQEDLAALESGEMEVLAPRPALLDTSHSPSLRRSPMRSARIRWRSCGAGWQPTSGSLSG